MPGSRSGALVLLAAVLCGACEPDLSGRRERLAAERETAVAERARAVRASGSVDEPIARWELPGALTEVSGLALTPDGRLFAHGDETGDLFEIDYRRGVIVKRFSLGPDEVSADFEALAIGDSTFWLLTSKGRLYEFGEGRNGEQVPYRTSEAPLGKDCEEFEGMAFDGTALVVACKRARKAFKDALLLFRWPPGGDAVERIEVAADSLRARVPGWRRFSASGIARRRDNGNFLLVAGPESGYLELTPEGRIVVARPLPSGHRQSEGIALDSSGALIISDEATGRAAAITVYPGTLR